MSASPLGVEDLCYFAAPQNEVAATWLTKTLGSAPGCHVWREPQFGAMFAHTNAMPALRTSLDALMDDTRLEVWTPILADAVMDVARRRFADVTPGDRLAMVGVYYSEAAGYPYFPPLFPRSKYVHVVRDPLAVWQNRMETTLGRNWRHKYTSTELMAKATATAQTVQLVHTLAIRGYEAALPSQRMELRFEELHRAPLEGFRELFRFMGVRLDEAQLADTVARGALTDEILEDTFASVLGKVGTERELEHLDEDADRAAAEILTVRQSLGYA